MINPQPVDGPRSPYSKENETAPSAPQQAPIPPASQQPIEATPRRKRRFGRWIAFGFVVVLIVAALGGYAEYKHITGQVIVAHQGSESSILKDGIANGGTINAADYTQPGDGRINILIVGIGGSDHPGTDLTDTMQVLSIDSINKKMTMTSVPRDLYVTIPGYGRGKINSAYELGEEKGKGQGMVLAREVVGKVLGINITNFALMDFSAIQNVVDDLGGIDVDVPKAISDPFFPCTDTIHYCPFYITAGEHHMDGATALSYSRSRETTSDFDRSARQQIVMSAIKTQALSAGVLANPVKVISLLNTLGSHFLTDLQVSDISSLVSIYKSIPASSTGSFVLSTDSTLGLLSQTTDPVAGYIEYPTLGIDKYSQINQWFASNNPDPVLAKEAPTVTVFGSSRTTAKQLEAMSDELTNYGYAVTTSSTPYTGGDYTATTGFTLNSGKQVSANYLTSILASSLQTANPGGYTTDFAVFVPSTATVSGFEQPTPSPTASPYASATP